MTLIANCEKHALKQLLDFFIKYQQSRKMRNSHKIKVYKMRCQKIELVRNFFKYNITTVLFWNFGISNALLFGRQFKERTSFKTLVCKNATTWRWRKNSE